MASGCLGAAWLSDLVQHTEYSCQAVRYSIVRQSTITILIQAVLVQQAAWVQHRRPWLLGAASKCLAVICNLLFSSCLVQQTHYENIPIQIYRTFHLQKTENFQIKKL